MLRRNIKRRRGLRFFQESIRHDFKHSFVFLPAGNFYTKVNGEKREKKYLQT